MRWVMAAVLACFLVVPMTGCTVFKAIGAWAEKQDVQFCVEYRGRHVCIGRQDGAWTFSVEADSPALTEEEKAELLQSIGHE